ncbi:MAG: hypothetical protein QOD11_2626 [Bradyrhizobium sp.]|jgi:hypothetical protein|nr:hypothetical protein [Bradyrhizobium sp.]
MTEYASSSADDPRNTKTLHISGTIRRDDANERLGEVFVEIHSAETIKTIGRAEADRKGRYSIEVPAEHAAERRLYAKVLHGGGRTLHSTVHMPVRLTGDRLHHDISIPTHALERLKPGQARPKIQVGPMLLDARAVAAIEPETVLEIARALVDEKAARRSEKAIAALSPDLVPRTHLKRTLCGTTLLATLDELIRLKKWPREIGLEIDHILRMSGYGFTQTSYDCPDFTINYFIDGPAAVNLDNSMEDVIDPGLGTVFVTLPAGDPPTYIKRVCFWLERALTAYTSSPFNLRNPAGGGRIPVYINTAAYGSATPGAFYLNNALNNDLLAAVTVHELFHMVQFQYSGSGTWQYSMMEGGAVWAEDANTELMNRYLDEAGTNFNGSGVQVLPEMSLETAGYKCSLFWRYVSEQRSNIPTDADEPLPLDLGNFGADVYRPLIEACETGGWNLSSIKSAIRSMPFYGDFYEFGYLDASNQDLTSSETTLGNYVLACYLKDLGNDEPDRRFNFMEARETIYMDDVIGEPPQPGDKLASVARAGTGTLAPSGGLAFNSTLASFGSRFYEVTIDPAVADVQVVWSAPGLTSLIMQIVEIDEDDKVRDIHRTNAASYTKQFANVVAGKKLSKIVVVGTGCESSGSFSLTINPVAAQPNVMVTRWNSQVTKEYEIDSRHWSWTWVSPDIWVDNDGDGIADGEVFFNFNNKLTVRLHNKGTVAASGISVDFWYQDATGGLTSSGYLPVQDTASVTQSLTGLSLGAGATNQWSVNWSPVPSGASHHFCVRAVVTVPGDPNTDNKHVLSNFGNVHIPFAHFVDVSIIRRQIKLDLAAPVELSIVPRLNADLKIASRDLLEQRFRILRKGEEARDVLRILHEPVRERIAHKHPKRHQEYRACSCATVPTRPDPNGHYPADPRTLPPGIAGRPMVTLVHSVNGLAMGGVTLLVTVDRADDKRS